MPFRFVVEEIGRSMVRFELTVASRMDLPDIYLYQIFYATIFTSIAPTGGRISCTHAILATILSSVLCLRDRLVVQQPSKETSSSFLMLEPVLLHKVVGAGRLTLLLEVTCY